MTHYELWDLDTSNLIDHAEVSPDEIFAAVLWYDANEPSMVKDLGYRATDDDGHTIGTALIGPALLERARQLPAETYAAILDRWTKEESA